MCAAAASNGCLPRMAALGVAIAERDAWVHDVVVVALAERRVADHRLRRWQ